METAAAAAAAAATSSIAVKKNKSSRKSCPTPPKSKAKINSVGKGKKKTSASISIPSTSATVNDVGMAQEEEDVVPSNHATRNDPVPPSSTQEAIETSNQIIEKIQFNLSANVSISFYFISFYFFKLTIHFFSNKYRNILPNTKKSSTDELGMKSPTKLVWKKNWNWKRREMNCKFKRISKKMTKKEVMPRGEWPSK